jgi:two-component system, cell cycle sensor histidine kinase and response regulator CckA
MSDKKKQRSNDELNPASGPACSLFETFPDPVYVIDPEGFVLDANITFAERFGKTLRECIGASIYELIDACGIYPAGSGARRKCQVQETLSAGAPLTFEDKLNGAILRHDLYPVNAENGSITKLFVISRQIAEEKCEKLTCAEILARTNAALENVSAAIWNLNLQSGNVVRSPGHDKLFGYDSDIPDWTNDHFISQILDEDRPRCIEVMRQARNTSSPTPWQLEFRIRRPDGSIRWLSTIWKTCLDEQGAPTSWSGITQDITEKIEAEQRYRQIVQQWNFTLESCRLGVWDHDFQNGISRHSLEHSRIFGYDAPLPEWNYEHFLAHVLPEDRAYIERNYHDILTRLNHWNSEYRIRGNDSQTRWLWETGAVVRDEQGKVARLMGVIRDITERKERESGLKKYKAEVEFALENSHIGVWSLDLKNRSVTLSIEQARILGYDSIPQDWSYEKFVDRHLLPEYHARIEGRLSEAFEQRTPLELECRIRRADGEIRWILMLGARQLDTDGDIDRMLGITTDITERKLAEIELEKNRQQLKQALAATRAGVWSWDMKSNTIFCSEEFWAMTGHHANGNTGSFAFFVDLIHPEDRERVIETATEASRAGKEIVDMEHRVCRDDGSSLWLSTRGIPQRDESGEIVRYIGTSIDISDRKREEEARERLQEQLRQSQKMELLGRLAGAVAHDFNNILTIILGNTELLKSSPGTNPEFVEKLTVIERAAKRSTRIVQQLLGFARQQKMEPSAFCADTEIEKLMPMLRQLLRTNIRLEHKLESFPAKVFIDPGQLFQIVTNLVVNARDAIADEGVITLSSHTVRRGASATGDKPGLPAGAYVVLSISDTGTGIDAANLPHIFEPFYTTKEHGKGTGLGLATVYGIVKQNGGGIECQSEPGKGATFDILLPLHKTEPQADEQRNNAEPARKAAQRILVVENEPQLLNLVTEILEEEGFCVVTASNAEQALQLTPAELTGIDLLLTDVMLPGLSGIDLGHAMRKSYPGLPFIFMSGYAAVLSTTPYQIPEHTSLLQKPFTIAELTVLVKRMLAKE